MSDINSIINSINKKYKKSIVAVGTEIVECDKIPFTSPRANYVTRGGVPKNKMIEFFGAEGGGKTTSALDIVANYQSEDDRLAVYVDLENTLDKDWGELLGVDFERVILIKPQEEFAETILDMVLDLIRCGDVGLVVVDSIPFLVPKAVMEAELESKSYAGNSALLTTFCSKVIPLMNKHNCTVLMINQIRDKMGVTYTAFNTCGGRMLKHSYSFRVQFSKGSLLDVKGAEVSNSYDTPIGNIVNMKIEKNKVSKPDRKLGSYTLNYSYGVNTLADTVDLGIYLGVINQSGAWFSYKDVKVQGKVALMNLLSEEENKELYEVLIKEVNIKALD